MSQKREREDDELNLTNEELLAIVTEIHESDGQMKDKERIFSRKYPNVKERYPVLFELACSDDFDMMRFKYMLRLRDQVLKGERTVDDTSKEIGQKMFDIYVADKVKK